MAESKIDVMTLENEDGSEDSEEEVITRPKIKLSVIRSHIDDLITFIACSLDNEFQLYYMHLRNFRELIIKKQQTSKVRTKLHSVFKAGLPKASAPTSNTDDTPQQMTDSSTEVDPLDLGITDTHSSSDWDPCLVEDAEMSTTDGFIDDITINENDVKKEVTDCQNSSEEKQSNSNATEDFGINTSRTRSSRSSRPSPKTQSKKTTASRAPYRQGEHSDKKYGRRDTFCFFCESLVGNFSRHINRNHRTEKEVKRINSHPANSCERKHLITLLRKKGNYIINSVTCTKPVKKSNLPYAKNFLPCVDCLGYYSARQLWRHRKKCIGKADSKSKNVMVEAQNFMVKNLKVDHMLTVNVFSRMRPDETSLVAKKDPLICEFGARHLKQYTKKNLVYVTSRKMRELAKILIQVKLIDPSIFDLFDALHPKNYDMFLEAAKIVAKYDSEKKIFMSAFLSMDISNLLKQSCEIAMSMVCDRKRELPSNVTQEEAKLNLQTMIELVEKYWRIDITKLVAKTKVDGKNANKIGLDGNVEDTTAAPKKGDQNVKNKKDKRHLIHWTENQKFVVLSFFKIHIENLTPPRKHECDALLKQFPEILHNKSWLKIKVFVQNTYMKNIRNVKRATPVSTAEDRHNS